MFCTPTDQSRNVFRERACASERNTVWFTGLMYMASYAVLRSSQEDGDGGQS